jgi:hypothetical protein
MVPRVPVRVILPDPALDSHGSSRGSLDRVRDWCSGRLPRPLRDGTQPLLPAQQELTLPQVGVLE